MCLVYMPEATNSAPSFIIVARTRSPSRSTNVTPLTSTTHLRIIPSGQCDFFQFDFSCATHGPESRPCRVQCCPQDSSVIVILSTVISGSRREIAPDVPFSDLEPTFFEVDGVAGDKAKWKTKMRRICQRANARFLAFCRFCGRRKIMDPAVKMKSN